MNKTIRNPTIGHRITFLQTAVQTNGELLQNMYVVEAADPLETEPVISDIPALILSGDYDPVTPPAFAQETAVYLDHPYTFEFEGQSHGIVASNQCGMELVVAFLDQPDAPPDGRCLDDLYFGFVTNP